MSLLVVTSRLSQVRLSRSPSTGGVEAREPVAMTTARRAKSRCNDPSSDLTVTSRSPASRP